MVKHLHELRIEWLQSVTIWRNEIEAAMNSVVDNVAAIQATFIAKEALKLIVDVLNDRSETVKI